MTDIKALIIKRGVCKRKLTNLSSIFSQFDKENGNIRELKLHVEKTKDVWDQFDQIQTEIEIIDDSTNQYIERSEFERIYCQQMSEIEQFIEEKESKSTLSLLNSKDLDVDRQSDNGHCKKSQTNLPTIELPTFDGSYDKWIPFSKLFVSLIENNENIDKVQKLYYLKSCLKGSAAAILENIDIIEENYEVAWTLLRKQFENRRVIIQSHIQDLLDLPVIHKESASNIKDICEKASKHINALKTLGQPVDQWGQIFVHTISRKLDNQTRRAWEASLTSRIDTDLPTFDQLHTFLLHRKQVLEALEPKYDKVMNITKPRHTQSLVVSTEELNICPICNKAHKIYNCDYFLKQSIDERYAEVKRLSLCTNCLRGKHKVKNCKASICRKCNKTHHTLLHNPNFQRSIDGNLKLAETGSEKVENKQVSLSNTTQMNDVLLSTANVLIRDSSGNAIQARTLLDCGSQSCFISYELCHKLKLEMKKAIASVSGINQELTNVSHMVDVNIESMHNNYKLTTSCLVIKNITENLPSCTFNPETLKIPLNLPLADPAFYKSAKVDILLGASVFYRFLSAGQIDLGCPELPILQKTVFGWIISGSLINYRYHQDTYISCHVTVKSNLENLITKFWEVENLPEQHLWNKEEDYCEDHYLKNTERNSSGRFIVKIPTCVSAPIDFGNSRDLAIKRLLSMERKFRKNPEIKEQYQLFMKEYQDLEHMSLLDPNVSCDDPSAFYLPHHCVLNENSTTTRLRVVFDGSSTPSHGLSVNDTQCAGPVIQEDLLSIILRFRKHTYVLTGDISKMYRQVLVHSDDRKTQRIVWRNSPVEPISDYTLNTVTYGTKAASFLVIRCLHQLAQEYGAKYPVASSVIKSDFYVDDLITGSDSIDELKDLKNDICYILQQGCFPLGKWKSNVSDPLDITQTTDLKGLISEPNKTLGLVWSPLSDNLTYTVDISNISKSITKRTILASVAKVFDPLGLLAPTLIIGKLIIQQLWNLKLAWDETIPLRLHTTWSTYYSQLHLLNNITVPRQATIPNAILLELHGFSDASEKAYGGCVYIKSADSLGNISVTLLCAKSRVAPLKTLTIPKLELCGATLLTQLIDTSIKATRINFQKIICWVDSKIVLAWIKSEPAKYKIFVANKYIANKIFVALIQQSIAGEHWQYVPTELNPADYITRGVMPGNIINLKQWWNGPDFLAKNEHLWPSQDMKLTVDIPEYRPTLSLSTTTQQNYISVVIIPKYSQFSRLVRVFAYVIRFYTNCKLSKQNRPLTTNITTVELNIATKKLVYIVQQDYFGVDIKHLKAQGCVSHSSVVRNLHPILDSEGVVRVGGRLQNSNLSYEQQHPMILPAKHVFTNLIVEYEHIRLLHSGPQTLLANLRLKFWIINGRNITKRICHNCVMCFRSNPKFLSPQMGNLPAERVVPARPFIRSGIDFAGPVQLKDRNTRGSKLIKGYICLFVCLCTKAVHIELVTNLTVSCFLAALRRFISRRGCCIEIVSDNGATFVGAKNELKGLYKFVSNKTNQCEIINAATFYNINWRFIPPNSPNFGGLWEAAVKSVKYHLKRVVGVTKLTYEDLNTILIQIEACLNSRPISVLSNDTADPQPLTPGHFLIGEPLMSFPQPDLSGINENRMDLYQRQQRAVQDFWQRWNAEYLTTLQVRSKWHKNQSELVEGDVVVISNENLPPLVWRIGRIIQLHHGKDGIARVATIRTAHGIYKRAVRKLCRLPIESGAFQGGGHV